jgi:glycosyltransferase involved in cell wall biosynthesis
MFSSTRERLWKNFFEIKKKMNQSIVTICITTYNRARLLPRCLDSVLSQTYKNIEIIIVDDCSTDNTGEVVGKYQEKYPKKIKYIEHKVNKGLSAARNTAISNASGIFFSFIDDDDLWEKDYIAEFVKLALKYDKNWCFCCGTKSGKNCSIPEFEGELKKYILLGYTPPVAAQFYYTETLKEVGGYDSRIKSGVDHDLWLNLALNKYNIKSLEKCLAIPNCSGNNQRMTTDANKRIKGIEGSLNIWKDKIISGFGKNFFQHFKKNYYYHMYKKFLIIALKKGKLICLFKYFILCPVKLRFIKELFSGFLKNKIIGARNAGLSVASPSFEQFIHKK